MRVLVDEAHDEAWSVRPEISAAMRPEHPADASYALAASLLAERDFTVEVRARGELDDAALGACDVLVIAHPSDPKWERTTGVGSARFSDHELEAVRRFVGRGGGLVALGETEQDKYGNNLNELLETFGLCIGHETVYDYSSFISTPTWVIASLPAAPGLGFSSLARTACFYRSGIVRTSGPATALVALASPTADPREAGLAAIAAFGRGRVAVFADSDLFGDDCIRELDHSRLWLDTFYWVARDAFESGGAIASAQATAPAGWAELRDAIESLRALQEPDGSIDRATADLDLATAGVGAARRAVAKIATAYPHEADYLAAVVDDLGSWAGSGFVKPDFARSLELFHPERRRSDGVELLAVFPMYTPNASTATRFEALRVEIPWPEWVSELEASRFDNATFVPLHLLDSTSGYDSECAVLFPETVSVTGPASNAFGGIFCDREASRLRRAVREVSPLLHLELPPEIEALLASEALLRETYLLWDLVHDRAHSHGDLPFDPFMVRKRLPYFMYSLEELRCDLTTFHEAGTLVADGVAWAGHVQHAIVLDRLLRFPITGSRVRNYDALAGQVLFGSLHGAGVVRFSDNRLAIDWEAVAPAVEVLRTEVDALYRSGITSSRVAYWVEAHALVARYVRPNVSSTWARQSGRFADENDPHAWVAEVRDDEFPLGAFYENLRRRVQAAGGATPARVTVAGGAPVGAAT